MRTWRAIVVGLAAVTLGLMVLTALNPEWGPGWLRGSDLRLARPGFHPWPWEPATPGPFSRLGIQVASLLGQFAVVMIVAFGWPGPVRRMADVFRLGPLAWARFLAVGALLAVALAGVGMLSVLSVHTFPLPFLLGGILFVAALLGVVSLTLYGGRSLLVRARWAGGSPIWSLALGTLLVFGLSRLPSYLGIAALAVIWLTGAGAALVTRFGTGGAWSLAPLSEDRLE